MDHRISNGARAGLPGEQTVLELAHQLTTAHRLSTSTPRRVFLSAAGGVVILRSTELPTAHRVGGVKTSWSRARDDMIFLVDKELSQRSSNYDSAADRSTRRRVSKDSSLQILG